VEDNSASVILTVFNQEGIIERIVNGILNNISDNVKELLIIFDACTDRSEEIVSKALLNKKSNLDVKIFKNPTEEWEIKCNNTGLKNSTCKYSLTVQDDCEIIEKDFDKRLLKPFRIVPNLLGVTARNAQDETIIDGKLQYLNVAGKDVNTPRDLFCIRDVIVRGPILFDNDKLKLLNYLDEEFAPQDIDDKDLCFRAYRKGLLVGSYVIDYNSPREWGTSRKNLPNHYIWVNSHNKNEIILMERHKDLLMAVKHDEDIVIK
jgi:glycosyltransferase involved in cell wall biosynthesis